MLFEVENFWGSGEHHLALALHTASCVHVDKSVNHSGSWFHHLLSEQVGENDF